MENIKYNWKISLKKGIKYFIIFLLPMLIDNFIVSYPEIAQLSIGGLLVMLLNFLKNKVNINIP